METRYWPVVVEDHQGKRITCVVGFPIRPSEEMAAALVRQQLGVGVAVPDHLRYQEGACLSALQAAGYRLLKVGNKKGVSHVA